MVHDRRPDEVVGAHRREQPLKLEAVGESLRLEMVLDRAEMRFVDERRPVAHVGEIDQRTDQGRGIDLVRAALGGEPGERDRGQRPAEAEGEQVGRVAGALADLLDRLDDSFEHIIADILVLELGARD